MHAYRYGDNDRVANNCEVVLQLVDVAVTSFGEENPEGQETSPAFLLDLNLFSYIHCLQFLFVLT